MSSKKIHTDGAEGKQKLENSPEHPTGPAPEAVAQVTGEDDLLDELKSQLDEAQSQAAEYKDGWQRSVAEFQNFRRRVESDKAEMYQAAVGSIIKRYLPILDDMERAMQARPADLAWAEGIELICRKLQSILEAEGLNGSKPRDRNSTRIFTKPLRRNPPRVWKAER